LGTIGGDFAMVVGSATPLAAPQLGEGGCAPRALRNVGLAWDFTSLGWGRNPEDRFKGWWRGGMDWVRWLAGEVRIRLRLASA
jgi:hypothetical protein